MEDCGESVEVGNTPHLKIVLVLRNLLEGILVEQAAIDMISKWLWKNIDDPAKCLLGGACLAMVWPLLLILSIDLAIFLGIACFKMARVVLAFMGRIIAKLKATLVSVVLLPVRVFLSIKNRTPRPPKPLSRDELLAQAKKLFEQEAAVIEQSHLPEDLKEDAMDFIVYQHGERIEGILKR